MKKIIESCDLEGHEGQLQNFVNHGIVERELGSIKIIEFKSPDSSNYALRYMLDGAKLIVTGDLGTTVYDWYYGGLSLKNLSGMNIGYFNEKCVASTEGKKAWDSDEAIKELEEHFKDYYSEEYENGEKTETKTEEFERAKEIFEELKGDAEDEWSYIACARNSDINGIEEDAWEWVYNVGYTIPLRHKLQLLGIKLMQKRIEEAKLDGKEIQN